MLEQGVVFAQARRQQLLEISRKDPVRALGLVMSFDELDALPEEIRAASEKPLSAMGSIDLRWETSGKENGCKHHSVAFVGEQAWRVNGPEFLQPRSPRAHVPIQGYAIGEELLVSPDAVRKLSSKELAAAKGEFLLGNPDGLDPITQEKVKPEIAALIGGKIFSFANEENLAQVAEDANRKPGAKSHVPQYHTKLLATLASGSSSGSGNPVQATPFQSNAINVLFIRVNFSDILTGTATQADLQSVINSVGGHINNYSYGAATITQTVTPQLYNVGASTTYTSNSNGSSNLMAAARAAAAANYTLSDYNIIAVQFPEISGVDFGYAGLASIGGSSHWINGLSSNLPAMISVMTHEFGHNYGLYHSNYWDPGLQIAGDHSGPGNASLEYGDIFDRMGSAGAANGYFSPYSTSRLEWMPSAKVTQPSANGTWRIYRFDAPTAAANPLLALKVPMGGDEFWWVGYRKLYSALNGAAYVTLKLNDSVLEQPNLVDMTPDSLSPEFSDRTDAGLPVGGVYSPPGKGVTFRTLATGGAAPNEWIDVQVQFDARLEVASTAVEVDEQAGSAIVTLRRSFGSSGIAKVNYATANGTATAGADYYATSGTVVWADGDAADKQIMIPIRPDAVNEGTENFTLTLSSATGGVLVGSQAIATVSIHDAGRRFTSFDPNFNISALAIVPLSDGKFLLGGDLNSGIVGNIARLNADGTEDTSFNKGTGFSNGQVKSIVVQSDGKILVGGEFTSYNGTACNRLARLNSNGTIDSIFVTNIGAGANDEVNAIAIEANGKILTGGRFSTFSGTAAEGLVRLSSSGVREALSVPFEASFNSSVNSLLVQADNQIMATGVFYISGSSSFRSGVARLNTNGSRDTSFDPGAGLHVSGSTNNLSTGSTIARQADGKYLIGGFFTAYNNNNVSRMVRVNSNGSYDNTFVAPAFNSNVNSIIVQPSGAIVVGGWFTSPLPSFGRLLSNGSTDSSFQAGTGPGGAVYEISADQAGTLFVGGNFFTYDGGLVSNAVKIAGGVSAYDVWAYANFTTAQITAGSSGPASDPDGDGISNIAEMAMGTSPTAANTNNPFNAIAGSTILVQNGADKYLQASFGRGNMNPGVWVTAQFSSDLNSWQPTIPQPGTSAIYDVVEDSLSRFTVRDKTPANSANTRRFMRFHASKPQ